MKKFFTSFLMAAAALMLLAGCSNLTDATVSGDNGKAVIEIGIGEVSNSVARSAARTINPTEIAEDATPATFGKITLKGESENGNVMDEQTLSFTNGTATVELSYDVWYLTLSAYSKEDTPVLILQGRRRVDMKNGAPASSEPITFTLSPEGVQTAGSVSISGTFTDTAKNATKYKAALYDLNTNEVITGTELTDGDCSGTKSGKFVYEKTGVNPGRYNFRIYFYMTQGTGTDAKDVAIGTWGDIIVVSPGRETKVEDKGLGAILKTVPAKPTGLSAYYVKNSANGNDYQVLITWNDLSNNEEYFKLTIQDVTGNTAVDYKIFGNETDTETVHVKEVFWESDSRVDGTLASGSNHCTVKLPLGKKFEISLKAVNFVGESEVCDRVKTNTAAFTSDAFTVPENTAYGAEAINLMKITYNLNGGILYTSATKTKTGTLNEYHIFKDADINLKSIAAANTDEYPKLNYNKHPFDHWNDPSITGTDKSITKVSVFGNKTVEASYNVQSLINYTINDNYGSITVTATQGSENVKNSVLKNKNGPVKIEWTDNDVTNVEVKVLVVDGNDVTETFDINGNNKSCSFQGVKNLSGGTYEVQVIVTKKDGKKYSDVFAITKNV